METWIYGAKYNPHGYFKHSSRLTAIDGRPHDPFIVIRPSYAPQDTILVSLYHTVKDLLKTNPMIEDSDIWVLVAWPGKERSDYFSFSIKDLKEWLKENPDVQEAIDNNIEYKQEDSTNG